MKKLNILCVDDQREVLSTVTQDLRIFEPHLNIEACESAVEAMEVLEDIDASGGHAALIISDHVMPGKNGVAFLSDVYRDGRFAKTKKVLLTGLATHKDTIEAINAANIDRYIEKPWKSEQLRNTVKVLLTEYILANGLNYSDFKPLIDHQTLLSKMQQST
jgi:two-component system chemotaxis response regulator CheY